MDGLSGFPQAIATVYPETRIQLCIVHLVRNALKFVSWKDRKAAAVDLKRIDQAVSVEEAEQELGACAKKWAAQYPAISKSWARHWQNLITRFAYPTEIRHSNLHDERS